MFNLPSPIQQLSHSSFADAELDVFIKRDDLIHPIVSGNKWRKLKYFFNDADMPKHMVSFGGAYSNHIHALSYVANYYDIPLSLYIRGEASWLDKPQQLSPTLRDCMQNQAMLNFLDRKTYRLKDDAEFKQQILANYPNRTLWVAEGGCDQIALKGVAEILSEQTNDFDYIVCPVGSATTLAGLVAAAAPNQCVIGIAALKQADYLRERVHSLIGEQAKSKNWQLLTEFHCGGFGKLTESVLLQAQQFFTHHQITLDPVYTSKMSLAFHALVDKGYFPKGGKVLLLHTGGVQGWRGYLQQNKVTQAYLTEIGLPQVS
ncbi:1-aminocyclopropane-1-carboxylate deaminase [Catenovulum agarivorans DS-2]|uniref:1-aminocyclopropane-1-carboxylate deaminase n=1 Tax=Catenovulum agarivorans DS-2 TaxID=1328313 RepID=W7QKW7_9ALTE|nr:pyridoxal-phosphate dependent enzyme [Catenovulum agarivorans]EWH08738.1 1-aminocyclopropane-1-carboxylate deaminase [Catenovulum agarivorans DS-2]